MCLVFLSDGFPMTKSVCSWKQVTWPTVTRGLQASLQN